MDMKFQTVKAGKANMFLSPVFAQTFATLTGAKVELYQTDGSAGAARGAGFGAGIYKSLDESISGLKPIKTIEPETKLAEQYSQAFERWKKYLEKDLRE
jgi:xylulokinase